MTQQGRKELRSIRLRLESTPGTPAAPRYVWRGMFDMPEDQREVKDMEELVGIFGGTDLTYIPKTMAEFKLGDTEATFEELPLIFAGAGFGSAGGSAQGASGSAVLFSFPIPAGTFNVVQSFTAEAGDNAESEQLPYALVNEIKLTFPGGEAMKIESTWIAQDIYPVNAVGSFSNVGTLIDPVEVVLASRGTVYLTPVGSGFGTGAVTAGNILGGELTFKDMWTPKFSVDSGGTKWVTAVYVGCDIEGELTFEHQVSGTYGAAGSAGQKAKWRNQDTQLMRLNWPGGTIPIGTTYSNKLLQIDLPIKFTKFSAIDDQDGNDIVTGEFMSKYNTSTPTAGRGTITVVRRGQLEFLN